MGAAKPKSKPQTKDLAEYDRTRWSDKHTPESGWGPFPYQFFDDLPRLTRGNVQAWLMVYLCRLTLGLEPARRAEGWPDWTPWCRWADLAERCNTTVRTVQEEAHEAAGIVSGSAKTVNPARLLIKIQERRGEVRFCLLWRTWGKLANYTDVPRPVLVVDNKKPEPKVLEKPFTVRAGRKSPPITIPGWDKQIAFRGGETDCAVSLFLESESRLLIETASKSTEQNQSGESRTGTTVPKLPTKQKAKEPALSVPRQIVEACAPFGLVDDTELLQLIADCQSYAPECTVEEIAEEVRRVGESAGRKVDNIPSFICSQVPKYFNSTAYRSGIKPGSRKPAQSSERDQRFDDAMKLLRGDKRRG